VISTGQKFFIANVYAPCESTTKNDLWVCLSQFLLDNGDENICVCGDFNSIRSEDERRGRSGGFRQSDAVNFNNFIIGSFLLDLPLCGRLFTWVSRRWYFHEKDR